MRSKAFLICLGAVVPCCASAHVTLAEPSAPPGADYVARFRVGHGCDGSPTTALSIAVPASVSAIAPQPSPHWRLGVSHEGGITNVTWRGGSLPANQPGEFAIAMKLPLKNGPILFPATQTCAKGREVWSQAPAKDGHHLDHPAPVLTVGATPVNGLQMVAAKKEPSALSLSGGWIRLLPGGLPAAGYFTLKNSGTAKVALTGADTPACGMLMLHKSSDTGGMSSMQDVEKVDVPGGGTVNFTPGGLHLMCMDPKPSLKLGASVPVTLSFQGAPPLTARFDVRGATGK